MVKPLYFCKKLSNILTATTLHKNELGYGFYIYTDIAQLLGLPRAKVNRYLSQYWDERLGKTLFNDSFSWQTKNDVKAVNFYVLIELYICFKLQDLGVNPKQILKAREAITTETGLNYPFATQDILSDGRKFFYRLEDAVINADGTRQSNLIKILKAFTQKIDFSAGLAERFYPLQDSKNIVIDPHHQFGQPVISGTNINAELIYSMFRSGESVETLSFLYELNTFQVNDAIKFYQKAA